MITKFRISIACVLVLSVCVGCSPKVPEVSEEEVLRAMIVQLVQAERSNFSPSNVRDYPLGSVLSGGGSHPSNESVLGWRDMINAYQQESTIPILYGIDAVHGHNNLRGATIFPHNIGLGAANNEDLIRRIAVATGKEVKATGIHWNFAPTLAVVQDIRWGRTYESFSEDPHIVSRLGTAYIQGLQSTGIAATAKHFLADGATQFNPNAWYHIDQGNAVLSEEELRRVHLYPYYAAIEQGEVLTVMISYSSINGKKLHGYKYWITDVLKGELGFKGLVISDWEAIHQLPGSLYQQIVASMNAGIDMLMQPANWQTVVDTMLRAVKNNDISRERIEDAYQRVIFVKEQLGLLDDTFSVENEAVIHSQEHKDLAREAVSKSLVLLKNRNKVLPLRKDTKILLIGPGADNAGLASGGWTYSWQGESTGVNLPQATTLKNAFEIVANEHEGWITTDMSRINEVDVVILALAELPYAEGFGDAVDLSLSGHMMHEGNASAIEFARATRKPVITILTSGRPRSLDDELRHWDAFVMAWLYGSEAQGITDVLYGDIDFTGKLPVSWPKTSDASRISTQHTDRDLNNILFDFGFGLNMK